MQGKAYQELLKNRAERSKIQTSQSAVTPGFGMSTSGGNQERRLFNTFNEPTDKSKTSQKL